jgi:nicotinamidase-related amidase
MPRAKRPAAKSSVASTNAPAPALPTAPESAAPGAALLAVDLQDTLIGMLTRPAAAELRARAGLAISAAAGLGIPVLFTEQVPEKLGSTSAPLRKLAPAAPVFAKNTFSAAADSAVLNALRERQIEHVLLIGLETPICVYQSALGLIAEGFQVTVLSDAIGARRPDDHATVLAALRHSGVHVLPTETVLYALLHDAGHPFFKSLVGLVKSASASKR